MGAREELGADRLGQPDVVAEVGPARPGGAGDAERGVEPLGESRVEREDVVFLGLFQEQSLQLGQLVGLFPGEVDGLAEVVFEVVELPGGVHEAVAAAGGFPGQAVAAARDPAVVVDRAVGGELEILGRAAALGLRVVERVGHRDPFDRLLLDTVDDRGRADLARVENRGHHVDDVMKLRANFPPRLDPLGPVHDQGVARAAQVARHLLGPLEGGVHGPGPADGHVRLAGRAADLVDAFDRALETQLQAEQAGDLAERAFQPPLGAGAIVAHDVHDERVVELARGAEALDQAADLVIGEGHVGGVVLHQARVHLPGVGTLRVPGGNLAGPRGELRAPGNDADLELPGVREFALLVPAVVERAAELRAPLGGGVMRRVHAGGAEVVEPGLAGVGGPDVPGPGDGLVGHVGGEVVALRGRLRLRNPGRVAVDRGIVLVRLALIEAVEIVEPEAGGPAVERAGGTDVGLRRVVPLAEHGRGVAAVAEHLRYERGAARQDSGVAGEPRAHLDDHPRADRVVIAAGEQRAPRGTA